MNEEKCPCCPNHCDKKNLSCGRGMDYFNGENQEEAKTIQEQILMDLRKCGHYLHHNKEAKKEDILKNLTEEELEQLHTFLEKIKTM